MAEMTIRRFSVLSVAKVEGFLCFVLGLIFGVLYGLSFMVFGAFMSSMARGDGALAGGVSSVVIGLILMVAIPVFYGILGFIGGAIGALIYNFAAGFVGGITFDLEGAAPAYTPPPPEQWRANPV